MNTINEVIAELLGSYKASFYITYFIFVLFGVLISLRIHASSRDKTSENTPSAFSWKFLLQDSGKTTVQITRTNPSFVVFSTNTGGQRFNDDSVGITTFSTTAYVDSQLSASTIEIRVYN